VSKQLLTIAVLVGAWSLKLVALSEPLPRTPPTEATNALSTFQVRPGFRLELAAAEPLVMDPIAMSFDEDGRLYVIEMRDYSERRHMQLGRVRLLEDTDGDGGFDQSTIFAEDLPWPTAVICYDGGVFVGATPDIFFMKDTDGDKKADVRQLVFTGFGEGQERLNVQGLMNSFTWGLDNRIHGAAGLNGAKMRCVLNQSGKVLELRGKDFSFDPRNPKDFRAESGGGQHGLSFSDDGRKFVCHNSAHIKLVMYDDRYSARNPNYSMPPVLLDIPADGPAAEVYRISPDEPWRVLRTAWRVAGKVPGPIEGGGRASGYFTSATGITIYRGDAFPEDCRGDAFIADVGSNLIHRKKLYPNGVALVAKRAPDEEKSEFIASKDLWFRPVQFANAPDGCLYIADMYREVVEHPWSIPDAIKEQLDLNSGNDRGRIYRIAPEKFVRRKSVRLSQASTRELVATLEHPNGWHRDTAARLLYQRRDPAAVPELEKLFITSQKPLARLHAFYALANPPLANALADPDPRVREHAVRKAQTIDQLLPLAGDPSPRVRYQVAFALGDYHQKAKTDALAAIVRADPSDPWIHAAVLSSIKDEAVDLLKPAPPEFRKALLHQIGARNKRDETEKALPFLRDAEIAYALAFAEGGGSVGAEIFGRAVKVASDPQAADRLAAVKLIALGRSGEAQAMLLSLIHPGEAEPIQRVAIAGLSKSPGSNVAARMVQQWSSLTPSVRADVLSLLLARPERVRVLLNAIASGAIQRNELSSSQTKFLLSHRDTDLRDEALLVLGKTQPAKRQEVIDQFTPALSLAGDTAKGKQIFNERCASCHRLGNEGYTLGPDLITVKSAGKEKLLLNIIDPNREILPNFTSYLVETKSDDSYIGILSESGAEVTIREAFGKETRVPRAKVRRIVSQSDSLMPEGLEAGLTAQAMADLLEFLSSAP
jgi:putative membrane-bound dehydrogenase-like protein